MGWMTLARGAKRLSAKRPGGLLAIDASGRRVIGPGGSVLAGSGQFGFPVDGQPATEAAFQGLSDVVEDGVGRIFVADTFGRAVYRVDGGKIEFVAGGPDEGEMAQTGVLAKDARFLSVDSIAVDSRGVAILRRCSDDDRVA